LAVNKFNDYDNNVINIHVQPFRRFKIPKRIFSNTAERKALSPAMLRAIVAYQPVRWRDGLARDVFLLSFCLCGMNAVDFYNCGKIKNGVLIYNRSKTKNRSEDGAEMHIVIPAEVINLASKYFDRGAEPKRVFNFHRRYATSMRFDVALGIGLKTINQSLHIPYLTFYSARHSWASIAVNELGIAEELVDECLVHAPTRKMLRRYVKRDWSRIDATNRKVLDYVFGNSMFDNARCNI
jgi:hypothetical protein